jgi:hypothetical protein
MHRAWPPLIAIALTLCLAACGSSTTSPLTDTATSAEPAAAGDIPDNQVFVAYTDPAGPFTVKVPEGWARTDATNAGIFTDKLNSIGLEVTAAPTAPTAASAAATEVPAIASSSTGYGAGQVTTVTRPAGDVVLITYRADSAPDPVTGKVTSLDVERYELWKDGRQATLTLSGPVGADNVDPWKTVTDSFTWQ